MALATTPIITLQVDVPPIVFINIACLGPAGFHAIQAKSVKVVPDGPNSIVNNPIEVFAAPLAMFSGAFEFERLELFQDLGGRVFLPELVQRPDAGLVERSDEAIDCVFLAVAVTVV